MLSSEYLVIVLISVLIPLYLFYFKQRKLEIFFKNFPTPPTEFFFGNARAFSTTSAFLKTLHKYTQNYGSMLHLKMGPFDHILIASDYEFLQFMLSSNKSFKKSENLRFLKEWIGKGLVAAQGDQWKVHRKLLTPAFHFKILEKFVDTFESSGDRLIKKLSEIKHKENVDIHDNIIECTFDIICETAMGLKFNKQSDISNYFQSVREMCRIFMIRTMSVLKRYDWYFRLSKDYYIQREAIKYLQGQTDQVINQKRQKLKEKDVVTNGVQNKKEKKVFLDILLEADEHILTHAELRDEVNTFMFGGHDTTAAASGFILYCLANHKNIQDKVLEEQNRIFGDIKNPVVTYSSLQEMKYLECVIKEGMRLYTPVPVIGRESAEDVFYNGILIPEGVKIVIFVYGLHMNPKYYPDPEKFDPERFESTQEKQPFAYIPFSAGPRNCIGQKFAMLEIKSLVAKIVRNFELTAAFPQHKMELAAETVLKSLNGVRIGLKLR